MKMIALALSLCLALSLHPASPSEVHHPRSSAIGWSQYNAGPSRTSSNNVTSNETLWSNPYVAWKRGNSADVKRLLRPKSPYFDSEPFQPITQRRVVFFPSPSRTNLSAVMASTGDMLWMSDISLACKNTSLHHAEGIKSTSVVVGNSIVSVLSDTSDGYVSMNVSDGALECATNVLRINDTNASKLTIWGSPIGIDEETIALLGSGRNPPYDVFVGMYRPRLCETIWSTTIPGNGSLSNPPSMVMHGRFIYVFTPSDGHSNASLWLLDHRTGDVIRSIDGIVPSDGVDMLQAACGEHLLVLRGIQSHSSWIINISTFNASPRTEQRVPKRRDVIHLNADILVTSSDDDNVGKMFGIDGAGSQVVSYHTNGTLIWERPIGSFIRPRDGTSPQEFNAVVMGMSHSSTGLLVTSIAIKDSPEVIVVGINASSGGLLWSIPLAMDHQIKPTDGGTQSIKNKMMETPQGHPTTTTMAEPTPSTPIQTSNGIAAFVRGTLFHIGCCSGRGACVPHHRGMCACDENYFTQNCSVFCNTTLCNGTHKHCQEDGVCKCDINYYPPSTCSTFCNATQCALNTSGNGECSAEGCNCLPTFYGDKCLLQCVNGFPSNFSSSGEPSSCTCQANFYGDSCAIYCDAHTTCSGRGTCDARGTCDCSGGKTSSSWTYVYYAGDDCGLVEYSYGLFALTLIPPMGALCALVVCVTMGVTACWTLRKRRRRSSKSTYAPLTLSESDIGDRSEYEE